MKTEDTFKQKAFHGHAVTKKNAIEAQKKILSKINVETVFDVGAYDGRLTSRYRTIFPQASVFCFEPLPELFDNLNETFKKDTRVKPFNLAISDKTGTKEFYINRRKDTSSTLPVLPEADNYVDHNIIENEKKIEVPAISIDDFCAKHSIHRVQVLKMDIQGHETAALQGAIKMLSQQLISLIYLEVWFVRVYKDQPLFHQVYRLLDSFGYSLYDFYNLVYTREEKIKWGDAIFINQNILESLPAEK
jgi:FkbM family methyltransferase